MLITYFDEVKNQKGRPFYWLGALVADAELVWHLERQVDDLSEQFFGDRKPRKETEFHAADIFNGHKHFKGWSWEKKADAMKQLISILGNADGLGKIYVKILVENLKYPIDVEETAFMFLVERVNSYLKGKKLPGLVIGDRENETVAGKFAEKLAGYKNHGTDWDHGEDIDHMLDTVHFTHSHHSRMLQLADLYVYMKQFVAAGDYGKPTRKEIIEHVASIDNCLAPAKYKVWPNQ